MAIKADTKGLVDTYAALESQAPIEKAKATPATVVAAQPKVKQIVRYLAKTGHTLEQAYAVADVDYYLTEWIDKGYKLFNTHYLGENPEGFGVLYVLVLDD